MSESTEPLIVLAPPRSFSSVVSAMLGQHPQMYGLPELHLFVTETVGELFFFYKVAGQRRMDGLLRVIAELFLGKQSPQTVGLAKKWMMEHTDDTTRSVFDRIIKRAAPRRVVEKSVTTVWRPDYLKRAIDTYPDARFLHLTRHPRAQCESMMEAVEREWRISKDIKDYSTTPPTNDPQVLWFRIHDIIVRELETVDEARRMRVRGEDILADPASGLAPICEWLGIRTDSEAIEEMTHPERSPYSTVGPPNAPFGSDPKFLQNPELRPSRAKPQSLDGTLSWRDDIPGFADNVRELAASFGYR